MRTISKALSLTVIAATAAIIFASQLNTAESKSESKETPPPAVELSRVTLQIERMTCGSCAFRIRRALLSLEGVTGADVNVFLKEGYALFDPAKITAEKIAQTVTASGYPAKVKSIEPPLKADKKQQEDEKKSEAENPDAKSKSEALKTAGDKLEAKKINSASKKKETK